MTSRESIVISSRDLARLEALLASAPADEAAALDAELVRADVVVPERVPPTVVTMNSRVRFVLESSGQELERTLVYPKDLAGEADRVSVLAPIGMALLGHSVGDQVEWPMADGEPLRIRIVAVLSQPERDGEFHR